MIRQALAAAAALVAVTAFASGNETIDNFSQAKKILERKVFFDHRVTLYCEAPYDKRKNIDLPAGFSTPSHEKRAHRVEWEHVVPAENFGRFFTEWREGAPGCVNKNGKPFKGRKCAEKENATFRHMEADLYNLYPSIGAVNALRSNLRYGMLPSAKPTFGTCAMKIADGRAEPPAAARGEISRSVLYMADAYAPYYKLSRQDRQLMEAWNKTYPATKWECTRIARIERLQGNPNKFAQEACKKAGF